MVPKMDLQSIVVNIEHSTQWSNIKRIIKIQKICYRKVFRCVKLRQLQFANRPVVIMQLYGQQRESWVPPYLHYCRLLWCSHLRHWTHFWQFRLWCTPIGELKLALSTMWDQSFSVMLSQRLHQFWLSPSRHYCSVVCYTSLTQISELAELFVKSGLSRDNKS